MKSVNAKHDADNYDCFGYQSEMYDGNVLYEAYLKSKKGSAWKEQTQRFEMNYLLELATIQKELKNKTYKLKPTYSFLLNERGKTRYITGEQIQDRIVKHALCDEILFPSIKRYLIYDNGASQKGKGISFSRKRLLTHLRRFYRSNKSNDGYVLLIDFSKYYDNIRHDVFFDIIRKHVKNETALWLLKEILKQSEVDVSYMTDEDYQNCMDTVFNSLDYRAIDKSRLDGSRFMKKHLNIGDQVAQIAGIVYPMEIDNYIKIVKGVKFYGRYMDDGYIIHNSKEFLENLKLELVSMAKSIGIVINEKKTRIVKLSSRWRYLQIQYSLTNKGRVITKINPKRVTSMRQRMKRIKNKLNNEDFKNWFYSWFMSHKKIMSRQQRRNIENLYNQLKGGKQCIRLH